jgi:hypothetical protein
MTTINDDLVCPECDELLIQMPRSVVAHSGIAIKDGRPKPFVHLAWGSQRGQLVPEEIRQHALRLLECAEAAETDCYVMGWLITHMELEPHGAARMLEQFRKFRDGLGGGR